MNTHRFEYLDSLRGLAAMSVVWSHFILSYQWPAEINPILMHTPLHFLWDGSAAVSFFFVLSGFVLSLSQQRNIHSSSELLTFYPQYFISRVSRIWMPYVFWITISLIIKLFFFTRTETIPAQTEWISSFWNNHTQIKHFILEMNLFVKPTLFTLAPHGWSLFIEMVFSFLLPIGILISTRSLTWLILITVVSVQFLNASVFMYHFLFGLVLARKFQTQKESWNKAHGTIKFLIFSIGSFFYGLRFFSSTPHVDLLSGVGSMAIIWTALSSSCLQKFLNQKILRYLGKISYSIYLCHFALLLAITPWFFRFLNSSGMTHWFTVGLLGLLFTTLLTIVISSLMYFGIETPSMNAGKILRQKWQQNLGKLR